MKTVLLLDDARSIRSVYAEVIRQAGFEAQTASSAEEGLRLRGTMMSAAMRMAKSRTKATIAHQ